MLTTIMPGFNSLSVNLSYPWSETREKCFKTCSDFVYKKCGIPIILSRNPNVNKGVLRGRSYHVEIFSQLIKL